MSTHSESVSFIWGENNSFPSAKNVFQQGQSTKTASLIFVGMLASEAVTLN